MWEGKKRMEHHVGTGEEVLVFGKRGKRDFKIKNKLKTIINLLKLEYQNLTILFNISYFLSFFCCKIDSLPNIHLNFPPF